MEARIAINPEKTREADFLFQDASSRGFCVLKKKNVVGDKIIDLFSKGSSVPKTPRNCTLSMTGKNWLNSCPPLSLRAIMTAHWAGWRICCKAGGVAVSPAISISRQLPLRCCRSSRRRLSRRPPCPGQAARWRVSILKPRKSSAATWQEFNALPDRLAFTRADDQLQWRKRRSNNGLSKPPKAGLLVQWTQEGSSRLANPLQASFPGLQQLRLD